MAVTTPFSPSTGRNQVADQVVSLLSSPPAQSAYPLLVYYLADVEREQGLLTRSIPVPGIYRSGLDFERFVGDQLPAVIVVAQPTGDAERYEAGKYGQWYELQIGAIVDDPNGDELVAQRLADWYGTAITNLIASNGGLGNPTAFTVDKTIIVSAPRTEFLENAQRSLVRSVAVAHTFIEEITSEQGPVSFGPDPYVTPTPYPTVTQVDITLQGETPAGTLVPLNGVVVTNQQVVVNE